MGDAMTRFADNTTHQRLARVLCHDVGAPSRALRQYLVMLERAIERDQQDKITTTLGRMRTLLDRQDRLLDELVDISGQDDGCHRTDPTPHIRAIGATLGVQTDVPDTLTPWPLSEEATGAVITELLKNVRDHATGTVSVRGERNQARFVDEGSGIQCEPSDIFTPFRPVHPADSENRGLGVARVSRLLQSIGASLVFECPETGGTTAVLTFPSS